MSFHDKAELYVQMYISSYIQNIFKYFFLDISFRYNLSSGFELFLRKEVDVVAIPVHFALPMHNKVKDLVT